MAVEPSEIPPWIPHSQPPSSAEFFFTGVPYPDRLDEAGETLPSCEPLKPPIIKHHDASHLSDLTEEQIQDNDHIIRLVETLPPLYQWGTTTVVRISQDTVVKRVPFENDAEAASMELVTHRTTVLVPNVKHKFISDSVLYLVMDYIHGQSLSECWGTLNIARRLRIALTLRGYIKQLRTLRASVPGPLDGSPCIGRYFGEYGGGPFSTYASMNRWYNHKLDVSKEMKKAPENCPPFDDRWPLVFTHQDLSMRNVILTPKNEVYVIDWGFAGFYPEGMEYACMSNPDAPYSWRVLRRFIAGFRYSSYLKRLVAVSWVLSMGPTM